MFDKEKIEIPCPGCGRKLAKTIGELRHQTQANEKCPGCGASIDLNSEGVRRGVKQAEEALAKLKRDLGKIFK